MVFFGTIVKLIFLFILYIIFKPVYLICKARSFGKLYCIRDTTKREVKKFPEAIKTYLRILTGVLGKATPVVITMFTIYFFVNLYMKLFTWVDRAGEKVFGPPYN